MVVGRLIVQDWRMAAAQIEFVNHCRALPGTLGVASSRRMFGGHGRYVDDGFIAIIATGRLYLKVDALTRPGFEAAGCTPFVHDAVGKAVSLGYFSAPDEAIETPPLMQPWARLALAAALRARAAKSLAARPVTKDQTAQGFGQQRAEQVLTPQLPAHHQRRARVPGADHGVLGNAQANALAGFDEEIGAVAVTRQPDPAPQHAQLAAGPLQVHGVAGIDAVGGADSRPAWVPVQ